jgi:hypothetical protein
LFPLLIEDRQRLQVVKLWFMNDSTLLSAVGKTWAHVREYTTQQYRPTRGSFNMKAVPHTAATTKR